MPIRILDFYKEAQISAILRCVRYTFLAMFGHREAELTARTLNQQLRSKYTHPVMLVLFDALKTRLNQHEWHQERLFPYLKNIKSHGLTFEEDSSDPAVIAQIKKIINLLQLGEEILLTVEKMGDEKSFFELFQEANCLETSDKLYELCQLLMWPDIDLLSEFKEECQWIQMFFEPIFCAVLDSVFFEKSMAYGATLAACVGHQLQHGVSHLGGPFHYHSLMDMKTTLAQYVDDWIKYFQTHASSPREEKHHAYSLEASLFSLLFPLERLARKQFLRLGIVRDLNRSLKHGHSIVWKLCHEINYVEQPNQRWVKEILNEFRFAFCFPLLSFLDKCEEKLILVPGGLANLVQNELERLFGVMTMSLKRFVQLKEEEETLVNSVFMEKRLDALYKRRAQIRLQHTGSEVFSLNVNEDILHNVYQMQRLFQQPYCIARFSSDFSPRELSFQALECEYLSYLKQHEIFLQAKNAYFKLIHYKEAAYAHYHYQIRRHLHERLRPLLPDKNCSLQDMMFHQHHIEQVIAFEERRFGEGLAYYETRWMRQCHAKNKGHEVEIKNVLNQTIDAFLENYQSLYGIFNEEVQTLLKPAEDSFLTNLAHTMTSSVNKLPYPEVSDSKGILAEPQSLVWIKRLANMAIHLSKAIQQCTRFQRSPRHQHASGMAYHAAKALCLANLVIVEHHARNALWILLDLDQDDYFRHFYTTRLSSVKQLHHRVANIIPDQKIQEIKPFIQEASSLFEKLHPQVSWFFHLPQVVDLLIKLKELLLDPHTENPNIIRQKLKEIDSIFTSILIEGDVCEESLLLKEGQITTPLIHILSHYHKGFLNTHALLLETDLELINQRLKALQQRIIEEEAEMQAIIEKKSCVMACLTLEVKDHALVMKVMELLKEAMPRCQVAYRQYAQVEEITTLLEMKTYTSSNDELLKKLIEIYLVHCEGVIRGKVLVKHAMLKKNECLEKKAEAMHLKHEAQQVLLPIEDVRHAVLAFKRYIVGQYKVLESARLICIFESKETLQKKASCLKQLEDIMENKQLTPSKKLAQMQLIIQKPLFKQTLLAYHQYEFLSFQWLWQSLWRLLSALSLYTLPYQKAYATLTQTLCHDQPRRWGFFSTKEGTQNSKEGLYSYITTPR